MTKYGSERQVFEIEEFRKFADVLEANEEERDGHCDCELVGRYSAKTGPLKVGRV